MKHALLLAALVVFNMGGSLFLAGVYPGGATGYIRYPNGTIVGFEATPSTALLYPGLAVLDAGGGESLIVAPGGLLVYRVDGLGYPAGFLRRTLPPYSIGEGYAVLGDSIVLANGTMLSYPQGYSPVGFYNGSLVLDTPKGLMMLSGGHALLYPGLHPVAICDRGILVSVNGTPGVLRGDVLTLYRVPGHPLEWGGVLDWSIAACTPTGVAYTSVEGGSKATVIVEGGQCTIVYTEPPAKAAGVAANATTLTLAFQAAGRASIREKQCSVHVSSVRVEPIEAKPPVVKRRQLAPAELRAPQVTIERRGYEPSPVADNLILAVYRLGVEGGARRVKPSWAPILSLGVLGAAAAAAATAALVLLRRRSAESAPQH